MPEWAEMNETESCGWLIENSMRSTMTWKMHRNRGTNLSTVLRALFLLSKDMLRTLIRSKIYHYEQTGCKLTIKQDASVQTTSMELDIGRYPGRVRT